MLTITALSYSVADRVAAATQAKQEECQTAAGMIASFGSQHWIG